MEIEEDQTIKISKSKPETNLPLLTLDAIQENTTSPDIFEDSGDAQNLPKTS